MAVYLIDAEVMLKYRQLKRQMPEIQRRKRIAGGITVLVILTLIVMGQVL